MPFSTWSLSKLAEFLVAEGVVDDISHEGLRVLLREEGVSFQVIKTFKQSNDPDFEAKKNRILELYAIADGAAEPGDDDPTVIVCVDEFGPLNLQPHPGRQWAPVATGKGDVDAPRRRRRRATYNRPHGVRHMMGAYDLNRDRLYGHIVAKKDRTAFLRFLRYVRSWYPPDVRIGIVLDNFSPHLSTKTDQRVGDWAAANNVELAYTPTYSSWLNRIEAHFQALRYFTLDGTDHASHREQASMIRRYIHCATATHTTEPSPTTSNAQTLPDTALGHQRRGPSLSQSVAFFETPEVAQFFCNRATKNSSVLSPAFFNVSRQSAGLSVVSRSQTEP